MGLMPSPLLASFPILPASQGNPVVMLTALSVSPANMQLVVVAKPLVAVPVGMFLGEGFGAPSSKISAACGELGVC